MATDLASWAPVAVTATISVEARGAAVPGFVVSEVVIVAAGFAFPGAAPAIEIGGQVDSAHSVYFDDFDFEFVADSDYGFDRFDAMVCQFTDVDEAVFAGQQFDECAECH